MHLLIRNGVVNYADWCAIYYLGVNFTKKV